MLSKYSRTIGLFIFLYETLICRPAHADIFVGPGLVAGPVNVNADNTFIVGSTTVTSGTTVNGTNVTGSILTLDSLLGLSPGTILVQTLNGNALNGSGGDIIASNVVLLRTQGGHGALSSSSATTIDLTNTNIQTTGTGAGLVAIGGNINATGVLINNLGNSTPTVSAGHGAIAQGGAITLNAGTSIATGAFNAVGLGASTMSGQINTTAIVPIVMNGRGALAIYLHNGGQVQLVNGSTLQLNASNSVGISVDNTAVSLGTIGNNLNINFNAVPALGQAGGTGVVTFNGGSIALENLSIQGVGAGAGAWARPNSSITLTGNNVININSNANPTYYTLSTPYLATADGIVSSIFSVTSGLPIGGLLSNSGTINSTGTTINVSSNGGVGAYAAFNTGLSFVNLFNNTITTTGNSSFGIEAASNGRITGTNTSVTTTGGGAALFVSAFNAGFGSIDLSNSTVQALGANTTGLASLNLSNGLTNFVHLANSSLTSAEDAVVLAVGGPVSVDVDNSTLYAQNGLLIDAIFNGGAPQQSAVQFSADGSNLAGNAHADSQSIVNMDLSNATFWSGASLDATNIAIDSTSTWSVTENSNITSQLINAGLISYVPPMGGNFKTVTTLDYLGSGGTLALNTYLGNDSSPSDLLVINGGTATGSSSLFITNVNGPGALTTQNGILVVDTINGGTTLPGMFTLSNPGAYVAAGPYQYTLFRSSRDASNPEAWYLRSTINCQVTPSLCGLDPDLPSYRPETSLYAALPAMALFLDQALFDTLHERVGDEEDLRNSSPHDHLWSGTWGRVIGEHGKNDGASLGVYTQQPEYDYNFGALQLGHDFYRAEGSNGTRNHIGAYGSFGDLSGDVDHNKQFAGSNKLTNYNIGGYWTHFRPNGAYLDSVIQGGWYDAESRSLLMPALDTKGRGFSASIEGGHPFEFETLPLIEPQAQLVYQDIHFDDAADLAASIKFKNVNSLLGRLGVRFVKTWSLEGEKEIIGWIRPNFWYNFLGTPQVLFSSATGFVPFESDIDGSWLGINLGSDAKINQTLALFANVSYQERLSGTDSYLYNGKLGLRALW